MVRTSAKFIADAKRLAIAAMFSDDELMDRLVLKGGNLLDVVYAVSPRSSADLDFSCDGGLGDAQVLKDRVARAMRSAFHEIDCETFDLNVREVPANLSSDLEEFWGGYQIDFKLISREMFERWQGDIERLRRNAETVGKNGSTIFEIDISKFEYCQPKQSRLLGHHTIFVYTPMMVICEKLRAICQQMPDYRAIVKNHPAARARDFLDIHTVAEKCNVEFAGEMIELIPKMFAAKRVPLDLLPRISEYREYHRPDFSAVQATVIPSFNLQPFDFYFDYVTAKVAELESLWNK